MANSKRRCGACKTYFRPEQTFPGTVSWCSPECGLIVAQKRVPAVKAKAARQERAQTKEARERIKTAAKWRVEAQAACNQYIRERDKGLPCVSCDKPDDGSHQRHASHYRSVKACSSLRYHPWNIYASCAQCNSHLSGNLLEFRIRLVRQYGQERVDWLESHNEVTRYTSQDLQRIKAEYKDKLKALRQSE